MEQDFYNQIPTDLIKAQGEHNPIPTKSWTPSNSIVTLLENATQFYLMPEQT